MPGGVAKSWGKGEIQVGGINYALAGATADWRRTHVQAADLSDASEVDTGLTLPDNSIVLPSVVIEVVTAEATATTKTIDVGLLSTETNGDADGFLSGADVSATGYVLPGLTETAGGTETHISAVTYGALIADFELGSNTAGDHGYIHPHPHVIDGDAQSVSVTFGDSAGASELDAFVYFPVVRFTQPGA